VPGVELGRLMYPLPAEHVEQLAMHLADSGAYGPLCERLSPEQSPEQSPEHSPEHSVRWRVINYAKWNDTREEIGARSAHAAKAAAHRWDSPGHTSPDARRNAGSNARWNPHRVLDHAEVEREEEKTPARPRAGAPARGTRQPPPASEVLGQHYAPSSDPNGRAAEARRQLAERERPLTAQPDAAPALGGEALARAQLAQARAARLPEITAAADDDDEPPAEQPPGDEYPF
jgi:hypothetical protein